ncbi:MAG: phytoene desaturase family protein [Solirubrobacteraceae bacterium]
MDHAQSSHDVLVIGGGHNGLTAAGKLARHGLDVLVLEAGAALGGQSTTLPLVPEAPNHRISPYAVDDIFLTAGGLIDEFELRRFGYCDVFIDPSYVYLHPDGRSLGFWKDARRTAAEIRAFSSADADAYLALMRTVDTLLSMALPIMKSNPHRPGWRTIREVAGVAARRLRRLPEIAWLMLPSAAESIAERFSHPIVRNALAQLSATCVGPIDTDGSAIALMAPGFPHRFGTRRPVGGSYTLIAALLAYLKDAGGTARTDAPVAEILLSGGERVTGVRLESGEEIGARVGIIASCDPVQTLGRLLPAGALDQVTQARVDHIPTAASGVSAFKVDLALNGRLSLERWQSRRSDFDLRLPAQMFAESLESVVRSCSLSRRGVVPVDDVHAFTAIPTHADPSLAPDGQDTLYLYAPVSPVDPHGGWDGHAERAADAIVAKSAEFFDGTIEYEIGRCVQSPAELARRVHATLGATVSHVDYLPHRLGPLRPARGLGGYSTPIDGLYLGGSGSHPGFGMTGLPGRLSARELIKQKG